MLCHLFPAHRKVRCCVFAEGCAKNIFSPRKKVVKIEHSEITARVCFIDGFRSRRPFCIQFNDFLAVNMLMNNARESAAIDRNA